VLTFSQSDNPVFEKDISDLQEKQSLYGNKTTMPDNITEPIVDEIEVMKRILELMKKLSIEENQRVLMYFIDRFNLDKYYDKLEKNTNG
jgi:hypothetical protein